MVLRRSKVILLVAASWATSWATSAQTPKLEFQVASVLAAGRPVIDKTGFLGTFDVNIAFLSDSATMMNSLDPGEALPANSGAPTIFFALQERLGLKLVSSKAPVEILVIDSVERPSGN